MKRIASSNQQNFECADFRMMITNANEILTKDGIVGKVA